MVTGCQEGVIPIDPAAQPSATAVPGAPGAPGPADPSAPASHQSRPATAATARELHAGDYVLTAAEETASFENSGGTDDENSDSAAVRAQVAACVGVPDYNPSPPLDETSGDTFTSLEESGFQATSRARILPARQISEDAQIVTSPDFGDCYRLAMEEQLAGADENGYTYEIVAVETPPTPRGATALVRTSMGVSDGYGTYGYVFDTIYFYVGQVAVELDVMNIQDVPPRDVEQGLIDQIAGKLTNQ
ncbi:hypothetical protein [Frankia sp. EI5c]|uniref:hypothetical protein n=1 Tax=Frankia sp. EI5c TaxID=683316 RepID=UPI0028C4ADEC|nr:hypothetical protein [Frankia sp. EI5c]